MKRSILAAALLLAAACAGGPAPHAAADRGEPAFQRVLDRVADDGAIDRTTALQAFALAFTPPPGMTRPPGPAETIVSGSGPLRWVVPHLAELTPAQQRAVRAAVPRPARTTAVTLAASTEQARFQALVGEAWAYWSRTFPRASLPNPIDRWSVTLNSQDLYAARAYSFPVDAQQGFAGPVDDCWIYFNPKIRAATATEQAEAAYHEVFHCFEAQMVPDLAGFYAGSGATHAGPAAWLIEGAASYGMDVAMASRSAPAPYGAGFWATYFHTPGTALFRRTYDAIGFFAHLAESGVDVMARMPAAMQAVVGHGNVAAFDAFFAGASPGAFFATWPTGLLRKPALGQEWDALGPGITSDAVVPAGVVADSGSAAAGGQVLAYANDDRLVAVGADVLLLGARPYARMRATGGTFDSRAPSGVYCTRGAACTCPDGSPQAGVKFRALDRGSYYLAIGGGPGGSVWSLTPFSLDQFCQQPAADACLYGTWRLQGVPSIPLPASVTLQRLDETLTVTKDGVLALQVDVVDSARVAGGPTATAEVKGPVTIRALAVGGTIQPIGADLSGLAAHATVGPIAVDLSVAELVPDIQNDLTPVAYRCAGGTLYLTGVNGTQFTFVKA